MEDELTLVAPDVKYREAFMAMVEDFCRAGEDRYLYLRNASQAEFAAHVRRLNNAAKGLGLRPGWVPQTTFWTLRTGVTPIIGTVQFRHRLTRSLKKEGGHIGYAITPSFRNQGYGTRQLALMLEEARALGYQRVLVTCDTDNIASARVIQKNGGVFAGESISDYSGKPVSRYWISLVSEPTD
ncbi:MAG: GNAT family N-acetyltransferase [Anaerolineae bacterium]